jgi:hypothetical protein
MGKKPALVQLPNGSEEHVSTWKELTVAILDWFGGRLPPPPQPRMKGSKRYLYHDKPEHERTRMDAPYEMTIAGRRLYVEMVFSVDTKLSALAYLCECVGESPAGFRIAIAEGRKAGSVLWNRLTVPVAAVAPAKLDKTHRFSGIAQRTSREPCRAREGSTSESPSTSSHCPLR